MPRFLLPARTLYDSKAYPFMTLHIDKVATPQGVVQRIPCPQARSPTPLRSPCDRQPAWTYLRKAQVNTFLLKRKQQESRKYRTENGFLLYRFMNAFPPRETPLPGGP